MKNLLYIAGNEARRLFYSPLAWTVLAAVQAILGLMFIMQLQYYTQVQSQLLASPEPVGVTDLIAIPIFGNAAVVLLLVSPLLTMRLLSDERSNKTLALLFSAPVSMTEIILGKYVGIMSFFTLLLFLICLMPLSLLLGAQLDYGLLASGLLGLWLILAAFAAVGLYMSSLTANVTIAAVSTFGVLLMLWILDWAGDMPDSQLSALFSFLSILNHYEAMLRGVFSSTDMAYYALFILTFLGLSIKRLDADRI
jgi:gliding motility-associated transport system permease protein